MQNYYKAFLLVAFILLSLIPVEAQNKTSFTMGNRRAKLTNLQVNNIKAIRVRAGDWIDAIQLVGSRKVTPLAGGRGGRLQTFTLRSGERVTSVLVTVGDYVNSIQFGTNRGRYSRVFGKKRGKAQSFRLPPSAINSYFVGFGVYAGQYVTGFNVLYYRGNGGISSGGPGNTSRSVAIIYADANFEGRRKAFRLGSYNSNRLGIGANQLSSLRIIGGYAIRAYSNPNFSGRSRLFTSSTGFVGNDWNDKISSLKVIRYNGGSTGGGNTNVNRNLVYIYSGKNYTGRKKGFGVGRYNMSQLGIGNDNLSSIRVPKGYKVVLFQDANFRGGQRILLNSRSALNPSWNNRTSSLRVLRANNNGGGNTGGGSGSRIVTLARPINNKMMDNGCRNNSNTVNWSFSWLRNPRASYYHIKVYRQGSARPFINEMRVRTNSYTRNKRGYIINKNRYGWKWKVRAMINGRWTAWSQTRSFSVEPLDKDCGGSSGTSSNIGTKRSYRVMFKNSSIFVVTYRLTYFVNGQKRVIKREKKAPNWSRSFDIPANAKNVKINIRYIKQTAWAELYRQNITLNRNRCFNVRTSGLKARLSQGGCF